MVFDKECSLQKFLGGRKLLWRPRLKIQIFLWIAASAWCLPQLLEAWLICLLELISVNIYPLLSHSLNPLRLLWKWEEVVCYGAHTVACVCLCTRSWPSRVHAMFAELLCSVTALQPWEPCCSGTHFLVYLIVFVWWEVHFSSYWCRQRLCRGMSSSVFQWNCISRETWEPLEGSPEEMVSNPRFNVMWLKPFLFQLFCL